MPNDNQNQDQSQSTVNSQPSTAGSTPPVVPDFMAAASTPSSQSQTPTQTPFSAGIPLAVEDTQSPPSSFDITPSEPKKKFGGKKIIATILGVLILAGGIIGGVVLTRQNQNINEEAAISGACGENDNASDCQDACSPNGFECTWRSSTQKCNESAQKCGEGGGGGTGGSTAETSCGNCQDQGQGQYLCNGTGYAYCGGCVNACVRADLLASGGCEQYVNNKCGTGGVGDCRAVTAPVNTYYCPGGVPEGVNCGGSVPIPAGVFWDDTNKRIVGNYCGTIQVDDTNSSAFCRGDSTSGCSTPKPPVSTPKPTPPPTPVPTKTPTPAPGTAMCVDVKAYTETWTLLTANQLAQLRPNNKVNFCVRGSTTQGTFNKAKFTINGAVQAETIIKRPGSDDFCQLYTIPTGTTSFSITAQINHSTLGWK